MAFEFFSLVANFVARDGPLVSALSRIRGMLGSVFSATQQVNNSKVAPKDVDHAVQVFGSLTNAVGSFHGAILSLGPLNLADILKLGTIAGLASELERTLKDFVSINDELKTMAARFNNLGLDGEKMASGWRTFSRELADASGLTNQAARDLAKVAIERGPNPADYQANARAAAAIAAQTGLTLTQTMRMVNMGEENYRNYARMLKFAGLQVSANASQSQIMERVNFLIQQGTKVQEIQQKTFAGRLNQLWNLFDDLRVAIAQAIGGPFLEVLANAIEMVTGVVRTVIEWVKNNGLLLKQLAEIASKVIGFGGAVLFVIAVFKMFAMWMGALRFASLAWAAALWIVRGAMLGVSGAIKALVASTVIGVFFAIAVAVLQTAGAFEDWRGAIKTLHAVVSSTFSALVGFFKQAWAVFKTEAMIAWGMVKMSWGGIRQILTDVWTSIKEIAGSAMKWILEQFGYTWKGSGKAIADFATVAKAWWQFILGELGILDIRIKQFALAAKMAWFSIPGAIQYVWDMLQYLADYVTGGWYTYQVNTFKLLGSVMLSVAGIVLKSWQIIAGVIGFVIDKNVQAIQELKGAMDNVSTKGMSEEARKAAEAAKKAIPDFNDPKYRGKGYDEDAAKMAALEAEAADRKAKNLLEQDRLRRALDAQAAKQEVKEKAKADPPRHGGNPPRGGFSDLQSVWKKMQEQAAGGQLMTQIDLAKKTAAASEETNQHLAKIRELMEPDQGEKPAEPTPR